MKQHRLVGVGMLAVAGVGLLTGCEVRKQFNASCTVNPPPAEPVPGTVEVDVEVPPEVTPGSTFMLRIDDMVGYTSFGRGGWPTGLLSISGAVSPTGTFHVGKDPFYGAPYPNHLELTVTGEPGEEITLDAVSGSSIYGQAPQLYKVSCTPSETEIVTIPIVEPPEGSEG